MHYGYRIVEGMHEGLSNYLDSKNIASVEDLRGKSVDRLATWENLDINYMVKADIDQEKCIGCGLCYVACEDGAHQAIGSKPTIDGKTEVWIKYDDCVGCNLCSLVCPVKDCITMVPQDLGQKSMTWVEYSGNSPPDELYPRPKHGLTIGG